jgi:YVTN family beta-propeller protein
MPATRTVAPALAVVATLLLTGCTKDVAAPSAGTTSSRTEAPHVAVVGPGPFTDRPTRTLAAPPPPTASEPLAGMPQVLDPRNIYAADGPNDLSPAVRGDLYRVYVPNGISDTVDVIDPTTYKIVKVLKVGKLPQHVVPSWDLRTLWVTDDKSNDLMAIDPRTATIVRTVKVADPYNLYFTPDGKAAMVMAESLNRIDFRNPQTMALETPLPVGCKGVDHGDFTADGRYFIASCEFGGQMVVVDVVKRVVVGYISLGSPRYAPQDVKLSPDGRTFYVADMNANGVWQIDARTWRLIGLLPTGKGAHGLYVSRDAKTMYVTNRGEGSVGLIDLATGTVRTTWQIGDNASPDMGNLNAAGTVLWLSGRYNSDVYAIDTRTGKLLAKVHTGTGPHGVCVWPQPGRYSLGHTGILR